MSLFNNWKGQYESNIFRFNMRSGSYSSHKDNNLLSLILDNSQNFCYYPIHKQLIKGGIFMSLVNDSTQVVSPSRTYVALCIKTNFDGYYFRKFTLPEHDGNPKVNPYLNNAEQASWYFLNRLDLIACIAGVIPYEDYSNIKEAKTIKEKLELSERMGMEY